MKGISCNTLAILLAGLLLAAPAIGYENSSVGKDSSSMSESKSPGAYSGEATDSMSERKATGDTSVNSAPMGSADSRLAASSLSVEQIRELQRLLGERGYSAGNADGIIGPRTQAAIRQFQSANDLTVSGNADQATLRALAPDAKKQEFFGLAPAYGEAEELKYQPMKTEPSEKGEDPFKDEPAKRMEQPIKRGY